MATVGILQSTTTVYEVSLEDMRKLVAADLGVPESRITVDYVIEEVGGDPMDRFPGYKQVTKVRIRVKELW